MTNISQTIAQIEEEIRKTPYHKGTEHHIGRLRARLARLKDSLIYEQTRRRQGTGSPSGFALRKQGDATVVLVGPPSSGKSTLINKITNAESKVAPYSFTTVSVIVGMLKYKDAYIQILDVPGLIEGASRGKGKGRKVLSVARGADLLVVMTDVARLGAINSMISELDGAGVRINKKPPEVIVDKKSGGGVVIRTNIKQDIDNETIREVAQEFGIRNAEITLKEKLTFEALIDTFSSNRIYLPALFVVNKIDLRGPDYHILIYDNWIGISAEKGTGLDEFKEEIWKALGLTRVYLVGPDEKPNFESPIIMKKGQNLKDVAEKIGPEFASDKKFAKIWGTGAHFPGQEASLETKVQEGMQIRFL